MLQFSRPGVQPVTAKRSGWIAQLMQVYGTFNGWEFERMIRHVHSRHDYPYPARSAWEVVTGLKPLEPATKGYLPFRDLTCGRIDERQILNVLVSLFWWLPHQPYQMRVGRCDKAKMHFAFEDQRLGVTSWGRLFTVASTDDGCQIAKIIIIEATLLTPPFTEWARFLYWCRHPRGLGSLAELHQQEDPAW